MSTPASPSMEARMANMEQQLLEIRARLLTLERMISSPGEHPADQTTVRKKVTYDWQA